MTDTPTPSIEEVKERLLPCDVKLPPALTITKGCKLSTLIAALEARGMDRSSDQGATLKDRPNTAKDG